jgi:hypothetical protein
VPAATREALQDHSRSLFVLASRELVSDAVVDELRAFGDVTRVAGRDLARHAARIADYRDERSGFGWGRTHDRRTLRARSFTSENLLSEKGGEARTGAFQPFGQGVPADRTVRGTTKASGTILYLDPDGRLSGPTWREMRRLRPDGVVQDGKIQVYLVGDVEPSIGDEVRRDLGYAVRELRASDPIELADLLDRWQAALKSDHPDEVVIGAIDHPEGMTHGMGARAGTRTWAEDSPGCIVTACRRRHGGSSRGASSAPTCT